jgi:thymidylate synthase
MARNVNDAWHQALEIIEAIGVPESSRAGDVRVAPYPVVTVYYKPMERVIFDPVRDANPIFHLHESLWMLAGQRDATWLDQFVSDFSSRFAEPNGMMHGAYGFRWRGHFGEDQLDVVIGLLRINPKDRQAVIQMWDSRDDLGVPNLKDRPCNTQIYLRIMQPMEKSYEDRMAMPSLKSMYTPAVLDMCVMCRSNDIVWGCYGANAVHFSILQEYLAARIGVRVGRLTQFSWNWHMYDNTKHLADRQAADGWVGYPSSQLLVDDPDTIDTEIWSYINNPESALDAKNSFLRYTAYPMWKANNLRKKGELKEALNVAIDIRAYDWQRATVAWLERRRK